MNDNELLEKITLNSNVLAGKPVIRGTRLSVEFIQNLLARGVTPLEIIEEYNWPTAADIQACPRAGLA
jgi:uncharacterized protein (DUF433 family)